ncbi:MAG: DUF4091 domain-containing protein [Kiritimatiellae bacterium]|nr:DUF4091 domain-containing protein [Kiritimatiellia bacterium]
MGSILKPIVVAGVAGLSFALGALEVGRDVKVVGTGDDQTSIRSQVFELQPDTCYAYTCKIRYAGTEGVAVTGPQGLSMYLTPRLQGLALTNVWQTPSGAKPIKQAFAFGQWHMKGEVVYEQAEITPVTPSFARFGDLELGYGERIDGHRYTLDMPFKSASKNHGRVPVRLTKATASGKGWQLSTGGMVEVTHAFAGRKLRQARVTALVDPCSQGSELVFEASADGGTSWAVLASCSTVTCMRAEIPAALLPAADLRIRVRAASAKCWAIVSRYAVDATLDGAAAFGFGATTYTDAQGQVLLALKPWDYLSEITGELLPSNDGLALWRESTGRKVFRGRPLPMAKTSVFRLAAARNEAEAAQLVVRADRDLTDVRIAATELQTGTACLAAEAVSIGRVGYLPIDFTMDKMGSCGQWPDPIFEQDNAAFPVKAEENQPFWIRVKPPKGAEAGVYRGKLKVEYAQGAAKSTQEIPFEVEVYDFDFPDEITCQTAFGLGVRKFVYPYHRLTEKADKEVVAQKYLKMLGEHHISPYDPTPTTVTPTWSVKWTKTANPADAEPIFDWTAWDAAMEKVFADHHFNTFRLNIQGLGSCDVTQSRPAKFCGCSYEDPLYQVRMQKYLAGIERHLAEKGWLDKAYVYCFDEPLKKDYALVMQGLGTVKKYAPRLRRMLTTGPQEALMPDGANLWNPLTYVDLKSPAALKARAAGDDFWWYITFSSQAPLVNEHVEHSGVDMRLWGWQTWDADVHGVLIWELAYWNGFKTLPAGTLQNPYEDAMCWTRIWHPWNSGEGRYIYPPKKCFAGGEGPVLDGPVDSIRFEMLREGLEDYEYFVLLKKLDPANPLLKVPVTVQRHVRDYSTNPCHMEAHREKLAHEIMRLRSVQR